MFDAWYYVLALLGLIVLLLWAKDTSPRPSSALPKPTSLP